jgi:8-oxo-dGTP diphosphatase
MAEREGEGGYDRHKNPVPAVDFIIPKEDNSKILLVRRKNEPFRGMLSIPGGFINEGETVEDAMRREAKEETSLVLEPIAILGVYSDPHRDPRMHTISVTFVTNTVQGIEKARDDAAALQWVNIAGELDSIIASNQLAFDHSKILSDYKKWIRKTTMAADSVDNSITFWSTKKEQVEHQS